jgi:rare lipoprotein A
MKKLSFMKRFFLLLNFLMGIHNFTFAQDSLEVKDSTIAIKAIASDADSIAPVFKETKKVLFGEASYYAAKFEGRKTANGEIFSHKRLTAACNQLPLGTWIEVTNLKNNKSVIVKTNDRLHPKMRRVVDLTMAAAKKLDFVSSGVTKVKVVVLDKKKHK